MNATVPRLLLIDDDLRLSQMIKDYLSQYALDVIHAADGRTGLALATEQAFDLIILDLMLPDMDGLDVCRALRKSQTPHAAVPVVMLTAKGDPMDRVVGLELGADDYLCKPFEPRELLARIRAILRRPTMTVQSSAHQVLRFGRLAIDLDARSVQVDEKARSLTAHQYELLVALAQRPGRVLSRDQIMDALGADPVDSFDRSIDVHIARIRAEIEDDVKHPRRILTVRGTGYVFAKMQP
jgi:DNA-binding response OmpR family regulator